MKRKTYLNTVNLRLFTLLLILTGVSCSKDKYLSSSDREALFKQPTITEIDAVKADWQNRNLTPSDYSVLESHQVANGNYTLKIVSYRLTGLKQYGAILISNVGTAIPVRFQVGGFGYGIRVNSMKLALGTSNADTPSILAIPALRGQSLHITLNDVTYTSPQSEGDHCDAFDGGTDDVIGFLNVIKQTEPRADVNTTSVRGGSRGGTVALLAGIRDKRFKKLVGIVTPVNMLALTADHENDENYQCQFLEALKNKRVPVSHVRTKLIASSPVYFVMDLPATQLHMGILDKNVPITQATEMESAVKIAGKEQSISVFRYNKSHTDLAVNNKELEDRITEFFSK